MTIEDNSLQAPVAKLKSRDNEAQLDELGSDPGQGRNVRDVKAIAL